MHRITQHSDSRDTDLHGIAGHQWAYASGRASSDDIAGTERHHARNPANQERAGINHQRSVARLADRSIYTRFDENVRGIEIGFDVRANGAEGVEAFAARKLYVALLDIARSHVIEAGIAENVGQGVIGIAKL